MRVGDSFESSFAVANDFTAAWSHGWTDRFKSSVDAGFGIDAAGISRLHELAAAPTWDPPPVAPSGVLTDLDRAVDVLVEMKNISEAAVGLAYSALALRDGGLAAEVRHLAERLDEMKDHLQLWVLRAAKYDVDPSPLRGVLQLASAAEELGSTSGAIDTLRYRRKKRLLSWLEEWDRHR